MAQKKLLRFAQIKEFANVHEYPVGMQGQWRSFFGNENPVILELACGRGEYTVGLAALYPDKNFIGIDIKGNRMYIGAKKALEKNLKNAAFLRTQIEKITEYFNAGEADEIWITFPDPQLRISKAKKRLTHPRFLRLYRQILKSNALVHLKTDSPNLYEFTKLVASMYSIKILQDIADVYAAKNVPAELRIQTHYEGLDIAKSNSIHYLQFCLPDMPEQNDDALQELLQQNKEAPLT